MNIQPPPTPTSETFSVTGITKKMMMPPHPKLPPDNSPEKPIYLRITKKMPSPSNITEVFKPIDKRFSLSSLGEKKEDLFKAELSYLQLLSSDQTQLNKLSSWQQAGLYYDLGLLYLHGVTKETRGDILAPNIEKASSYLLKTLFIYPGFQLLSTVHQEAICNILHQLGYETAGTEDDSDTSTDSDDDAITSEDQKHLLKASSAYQAFTPQKKINLIETILNKFPVDFRQYAPDGLTSLYKELKNLYETNEVYQQLETGHQVLLLLLLSRICYGDYDSNESVISKNSKNETLRLYLEKLVSHPDFPDEVTERCQSLSLFRLAKTYQDIQLEDPAAIPFDKIITTLEKSQLITRGFAVLPISFRAQSNFTLACYYSGHIDNNNSQVTINDEKALTFIYQLFFNDEEELQSLQFREQNEARKIKKELDVKIKNLGGIKKRKVFD